MQMNFWIGLAVWIALYISDYSLTLTCARLYQAGASRKFGFEGSYEITPIFQKDIDSLRRISPRFVTILVVTSLVLALTWLALGTVFPELPVFLLGMLVSVQLSIHMRHFRNLHLFRAATRDEVQGRIAYPRAVMLRISSYEMIAFAGMFLVLYAFTLSWFVLGGVLGCLSVASKHGKYAKAEAGRKADAPAISAESSSA